LTRQLLTFSRRQVMQPRRLDLNEVVGNMTKMLGRILGEDITLQVDYWSQPPLVQADVSMMEQVVLNLAVNARDAMPRGGQLTIKLEVVDVDKAHVIEHPEARTGRYARLTTMDTGSGIAPEHLRRIFEPFFTTKEVGEGTGLGLSVVYGIVKQSNGYITVHSEPGRGAEFRICLPSVLETPEPVLATEAAPEELRGEETILVAEDEPALRDVIRETLEDAGYQVLVGRDVDEAVQIASEHKGPLNLLLTDVVMPDLSGFQLAQRLQSLHPQVKVLYMSGYLDPRISNSAPLSEADFLQKPFTKRMLLQRLREVLEGRETSG
jgi:CheY-like chemotaxis protein